MADAIQPALRTAKFQNHTNCNVNVKISSHVVTFNTSFSLKPNEEREFHEIMRFTLVDSATGDETTHMLSIDKIKVEREDGCDGSHLELQTPYEGVQSSNDNCLFEITDNGIRSLGPYTNQVEEKEVPNFHEWQKMPDAKDRAIYAATIKNLTNFDVTLTMHSYDLDITLGGYKYLVEANKDISLGMLPRSLDSTGDEGEPKCAVYLTTTDHDGIPNQYTYPIDAFEVERNDGSGSRLVVKAPFEMPKGLTSAVFFPVLPKPPREGAPYVAWLFHIEEHEIRAVRPLR